MGKILSACAIKREHLNAHYNDWLHAVFVTGTQCYGVDRTFVCGRQTVPGLETTARRAESYESSLATSAIQLPVQVLWSTPRF